MTMRVNTANGGTLNLRKSPTGSSMILTQIPNGTKLEVEKENDTWVKTTYNNVTGYVMTKYLSEVNSTSNLDKAGLQAIYDSLKTTLSMIEKILK